MGLFQNLFRGKRTTEYTNEQALDGFDESGFLKLHQFEDATLREKYIVDCLGRMKDAADELDVLNREYDSITGYLQDSEELDRLPETLADPLRECATRIMALEAENRKYDAGKRLISEEEFLMGQRLEPEMPECYDKIKQAEDYQRAIKSDLNKMEGEKQAYLYRRKELEGVMANLKGVVMIGVIATLVCVLILAVMQFAFELDTYLGYLLALVIAAVAFTILFIKSADYRREAGVVDKTICKLIQMHNAIKIRYVNNTNLLEYLYLKYEVNSAKELKAVWDKYVAEKAEREKFEKTQTEITLHKTELLRQLKTLPISNPNAWLHQSEALVNRKEMVEIRHGLISQRQSLRKQMEFNKENALKAKKELESLLKAYPQYSSEVLIRLDEFDKRGVTSSD